MTSFAGIEQASTALNAARYGLSIVSQNIANANTPGYTRQVANQASVDAVSGVPQLYSTPGLAGGVTVTSTSRMNDPVIDARARLEHSRGGMADQTANALSQIESIFPEPSDNGLSEQLNKFWNSWSSVANDPGSNAARSVLLNSAQTVAATLNSMSTTLGNVAAGTTQSLNQDLTAVNSAATALGTLNNQIAVATATGQDPNALLDQRDQLLMQLSHTVGAVATLNSNGSVDVSVGGQVLVTGNTVNAMTVDSSNQVYVGGTGVTLAGGTAASEVNTLTTVIPGIQSQLDNVADTLASTVNGAQAGGYDLSGNAGAAIFSGSGASGITVSMTDPTQIAASSSPGGNLDGSNALAVSHMGLAAGSPDSLYTTLVGSIGSASAVAQQQQTTQASVTASVDGLQQASSGVNYDEEVSNMLTYQHAYQAASRVLTTVDSMLDTLINHTGLVGQA
jgi:flagellar hook-associated protein 1 FlgK